MARLRPRPVLAPVRAPDRFLVFGAPQIADAEVEEIVATMRSTWLGTGPRVARFEDLFRARTRARHALAVNSCTAALHLAVLASGIGPGDEVIVPALTFCATANAVIHTGATPVVADVDPVTMNLDPADVAARLTPRTRAVVPVHFAGRPCDMGAIGALATRHGLVVIEDCAHAVETVWDGVPAGRHGDLGCFSFYATKNVTTGEGGMVVTDRDDLAEIIKVRALHGMTRDAWRRFSDDGYRHYQVIFPGFKYNMMDLQAAIGIHQLARVEANWRRRREVWGRYMRELAGLGLGLPAPVPSGRSRHAHHLFTVLVDPDRVGIGRDAFLDAMTAQGIGVGVHYLSLPEHPYYREALGWAPEDVPVAARIGRQTVSIPLSPALSDDDVDDVVEAVRRVVASA
jgi:dTDP-4-amino-4,6-dideoxygalactose transaminase